jgi:hypothetical protein
MQKFKYFLFSPKMVWRDNTITRGMNNLIYQIHLKYHHIKINIYNEMNLIKRMMIRGAKHVTRLKLALNFEIIINNNLKNQRLRTRKSQQK